MQAGHMQRSVAILVQISDQLGIGLKKGFDFVGITLARCIVNWPAECGCRSAEQSQKHKEPSALGEA
jgi:hypothetical protein